MAAAEPDKGGLGVPADALSAFAQSLVDAARHPPAEPAPDPQVSAAFALGWQMAELYRPDAPTSRPPADEDDLPGLGRLDDSERGQIALKQVEAAVTKLGDVVSAAGLPPLSVSAFASCLTPGTSPDDRQQALCKLHVEVLSSLTALADTCRNPRDANTLQDEFAPKRIAKLQSWLLDLASALPAHAGHSVSDSLSRWLLALPAPKHPAAPNPVPAGMTKEQADALALLQRQGQVWRALLSAEKAGTDMLEIGEYVDAATRLLRTARRLLRRFIIASPLLIVLIVALFAGGVFLMLNQRNSASIVAGAGGILASVGITWKSVGSTLGGIGAKMEQQLWGAELDTAIADAITLISTPRSLAVGKPLALTERLLASDRTQRLGDRQQLARAALAPAAVRLPPVLPARPLQPQLLDGVLDPQQLLDKLDGVRGLRELQAHHGAELSPDQQLRPGHLDQLSSDIRAEKNDPTRVIRARSGPPPGGPPAPPPVIYLSRKPSVSQFMGVITQCFEAELQGPAIQRLSHLHSLDQLWRDVEQFTEDLRSRFREFGPCDIRFLEPKLAQVWAAYVGKHGFATNPPEVRLGENAVVIVLGDWATALPQARNVAARIKEQIAALAPGTECHVIHLGDTYYSGLEAECRQRFLDQWPVQDSTAASSWTLAGNHDMYAGGHGYFEVLLGDRRFASQQGCSYFALTNDHWQILGLDSSSKNPGTPDLQQPQGDWLAGRVRRAGRRTVLLTHHQPFSAYEQVNSPLAGAIAESLAGLTLDAWLWGHEHRCAVYKPDVVYDRYQANANYTAIVGHGGVPNLVSAPSSGQDPDAFKWQFADYYQVGDDRWGLGGFAVLSFAGPRLEIQYYDEYGKPAHDGAAMGYVDEQGGLEQARAIKDERKIRPPDVLGV